MNRFRVAVLLVAGLAVGLALAGCDMPSDRLRFAFISNNPDEFWTIARAGTAEAAEKFGVAVEFYMPANGTAAEQHRIIENLVCKGVKGIAISPNDAANQSRVFNHIIPADVPFITQDSDLPSTSHRRCYLGTDNIKAGRAVGELVKEALPEGGKIMIYVGMLDAQNAQERRLGMIAALANEPDTDAGNERARRLAEQSTYSVGKYIILGTMTDEVSASKCKKNAEDTLVKYPDVKCLVGLWAYNPPALLQAVHGKEGKVKIIGFDEREQTLQGIKKGHIYATVVQDPYRFGFESVRILLHLHRYGKLPEPEQGTGVEKHGTSYYVRHRVIRRKQDLHKDRPFEVDVEVFHEQLKRMKR
jgi:ribose transport system substrate-binding protein